MGKFWKKLCNWANYRIYGGIDWPEHGQWTAKYMSPPDLEKTYIKTWQAMNKDDEPLRLGSCTNPIEDNLSLEEVFELFEGWQKGRAI